MEGVEKGGFRQQVAKRCREGGKKEAKGVAAASLGWRPQPGADQCSIGRNAHCHRHYGAAVDAWRQAKGTIIFYFGVRSLTFLCIFAADFNKVLP